MQENRGFFRVTNQQAIKSKYRNEIFKVIDISGSGVKLASKDIRFLNHGFIEILINYISKAIDIQGFSLNLEYELVRTDANYVMLAFTNENQRASLLSALKKIATDKSVLSKTYY